MLTWRKKPAGCSAARSQHNAMAEEQEKEVEEEKQEEVAVGGISGVGRLQRQHEM